MSMPEENDLPSDLDEEYESEIYRRLAESDSGQARMFSLEQVMAELRNRRDANIERLKVEIAEGLKGEGTPADQVFNDSRRNYSPEDRR